MATPTRHLSKDGAEDLFHSHNGAMSRITTRMEKEAGDE
jgi:hypothetical protein